jgi:hypothetical protein
MKRSNDDSDLTNSSSSSSVDDEMMLHNDMINYSKSMRDQLVLEWISNCDKCLISDTTMYGEKKKCIAPIVISRLTYNPDCMMYYSFRLIEAENDKKLCRDICPVFILHAVAKLLSPDNNPEQLSYEWQFILHIIKTRLIECKRDIGLFLNRLFDLIYNDRISPPIELSDEFKNIITIFLHENLSFLVKRGDHYILSTERIHDPIDGLRDIVVTNLLSSQCMFSDAQNKRILEECSYAQNEAIAVWNKYQFMRNTFREIPLRTDFHFTVPKKKVREGLDNKIRFSDKVTVYRYSYVK